jgi:hypothetical protein
VAVHGMDVFFVYGFKNYSGNATVIKGGTPRGKRKKSRVYGFFRNSLIEGYINYPHNPDI